MILFFFWKIWKFRTKINIYFRTETFGEWSGQFEVVAFSLGARLGLFWAISQFECEIFWIFNQKIKNKDNLRLTNYKFESLFKMKLKKLTMEELFRFIEDFDFLIPLGVEEYNERFEILFVFAREFFDSDFFTWFSASDVSDNRLDES